MTAGGDVEAGRADRDGEVGGAEHDEDEGREPLRRAMRATGTLVGLAAVAGCSDLLGDGVPGMSDERPERDPAAGLSTDECAAGLDDMAADAEDVDAERAVVQAEIAELEARVDRLETEREIFAPVERSVVERAEAIGRAARPATVYLEFEFGHATGWFLDERHVVTNAHNVLDGHGVSSPTVWTVDGDSYGAEVVDAVATLNPDVALLRTDRAGSASLEPGDSTALEAGDRLVQVGHPGGTGNWIVSLGEFLESERWVDAEFGTGRDLTTTVPGRTGVSGSPILDFDGEVVGLTHSGTDAYERPGGERPIPSPEFVYDRMIGPRSRANHVPVETVLEAVDAWR